MDLLSFFQSVALGIVEGLTEFLPISSTGHLIISGDLLNYTGEQAKTFEIVIQLGAILAVCWLYRQRLMRVVAGLQGDAAAWRFVINLLVGVLPSVVFGLALHSIIKAFLFDPLVVAVALIVGGLIIFAVERRPLRPRVIDVDQMRWQDALKVGFAQVVSLVPGTSRSGATIIGGMLAGLSRQAATEFSFFLAIPTMFLATGYDVYTSWHSLSNANPAFFAVGFVTAFFSALLAIKGLIRYVGHHDFRLFAWYRVIFGAIALVYFLC